MNWMRLNNETVCFYCHSLFFKIAGDNGHKTVVLIDKTDKS